MIALRVALAVRGWSCADLAWRVGVAEQAVQAWARGKNLPSPDNLVMLRTELGDDLTKAEQHYGACTARRAGRPAGARA